MDVTFGVIGCGGISRFHLPGLSKAGARVKWACDLSEEAARPWVEKSGAKYTRDYRRITDDPEVNAVDVMTISSFHKETCLAAINAGKAVICEKTLAENADDALAVVRRAREKKVILYTSYMKRYIPAVAQAKALLPEIGAIVSTYIRAYQPWGAPWDRVQTNTGWMDASGGRMSEVRRRYGGGILVCGGSHILDLTCFFLGRPRRLTATMHTPEGSDCDTQAAAFMETSNGVAQFEALAHGLRRIGFLRDGWDERIEINGTKGRLDVYTPFWDHFDRKAGLLVHHDEESGQAREYRYAPSSPFEAALATFCRNIGQSVQGEQSDLTGYDVDELISTIQRSAASGATMDVNYRI